MRSKILTALILVGSLTIMLVYLLLFQPQEIVDPMTGFPTGEKEDIFISLSNAYEDFKLVKDVDYEGQKNEYDRLNSQLQFVETEIQSLTSSLLNIESEKIERENQLRAEKTAEINKKASEYRNQISSLEYQIALKKQEQTPDLPEEDVYLDSTSDLVYSLLLNGLEGTTSDIVKFVGQEADEGYYTVKLIGYLDSLTEALDNITSNLEGYDVSIGHCSLRQIYSCYNNMRPWDKTTLLNWYDNKYVTGSGSIGSVGGGYIVNGININGILGEDTVKSLTAAKDKDVAENNAFYQVKIDKIEAERIVAVLAAYNGKDSEKVSALLRAVHAYYDAKVAEVEAERALKENEILKTFNDRIAALDNPTSEENGLGNPDLLIYTLDITISVYNNK
jgi:hypothetical protein